MCDMPHSYVRHASFTCRQYSHSSTACHSLSHLFCKQEYNEDKDRTTISGLPHTMMDSLLRQHFAAQAPSSYSGFTKPFFAPQAVDDTGCPMIEVDPLVSHFHASV